MKFAFEHNGEELNFSLIEITVAVLTGLLRFSQCSIISQDTLSYLLKETIHALLDYRIDAASFTSRKEKTDDVRQNNLIRTINKVRHRYERVFFNKLN